MQLRFNCAAIQLMQRIISTKYVHSFVISIQLYLRNPNKYYILLSHLNLRFCESKYMPSLQIHHIKNKNYFYEILTSFIDNYTLLSNLYLRL